MKRIGKYLSCISILCIALCTARGQDANFFASVDKNPVGVGDAFSLKLTLENASGDITPPDLSDFQVVFGPSRSSNYRIINGRQSSTLTLSYTMRPTKTGTFTIEAAQARVNGKVLASEPIQIKVIQGSSTTANTQNSTGGGQSKSAAKADENLKVQIQLSKRKAYLGEQIVATYVLLTRYSNIDLEETSFPTLTGFWTEDLKNEQSTWEREYEMINGVPYRKAILKRQILFPQRSGELSIEPITLTCRANRSFFNPGTELKAVSNSPNITVVPLPEQNPQGYIGAVGDYDFTIEIDRTEVAANEAIDLKVAISGKGNLPLINEPQFTFPKDFEVYDPETTDRISVSENGVSGSRTFQYLIIPRFPGDYEVPKIEFSYFDPRQEKFITESAGPWQFKITGEAGGSALRDGGRSQNRVEQSAKDIRYIAMDSDQLLSVDNNFFGTTKYYLTLGAPFILLILFVGIMKRQISLGKDVSGNRQRKANKMARRRLNAAQTALKNEDSKGFYAEIFRALYGYLGDKLDIGGSRLSRNAIRAELDKRNVDEVTLQDLTTTLDTCEMARFAPTSEQQDAQFYQQTVNLISKLENQIR